jgi:hypothetical protein
MTSITANKRPFSYIMVRVAIPFGAANPAFTFYHHIKNWKTKFIKVLNCKNSLLSG